jgi:choline dehydrogenase-like flavoprotein
MSRHDHLANYGLMVRDRSTGSVRRRGGQPLVTYRLHDDDALDLGRGLLIAADALFASGAEKVLLPVFGDDAQITPDQRARLRPEAFTRERLIVSGFHPQGTAGIGRVVDANLALYDTPRVHVCDASVLPDSPGVNPQVTIMALSLRLADHLAEHL